MEDLVMLVNLPIGWALTQLEELSLEPRKDIVDGPFGSNLKASEYLNEGVPIIRLQNIDRNIFINNNIKFISPKKANDLQRHNFIQGDIVITKLGEPLGKACLIPDFLREGIIVADLVRVRVEEKYISKNFLVYLINSHLVVTQLQLKTKGTTRPRVNLAHIRELKLPLPPLNEQRRIVAKIEALKARSQRVKEALEDIPQLLDQFRQSVLAAAFRGELVPQDPNDEPASVLLERIRAERAKLQTKTAKKSTTKTSARRTKKTQPQQEESVQLELGLE
ncbi:hypothetical protein FACHB389_31185 [Nostoc calcicola FACHB-389]|nr:restriction endonuclease subunit S [Nostoc calcicola FACHB-3891]OKH22133.1 hypothetical protein FACHB389_31185 [Nostoc calcicola FACHB-389]